MKTWDEVLDTPGIRWCNDGTGLHGDDIEALWHEAEAELAAAKEQAAKRLPSETQLEEILLDEAAIPNRTWRQAAQRIIAACQPDDSGKRIDESEQQLAAKDAEIAEYRRRFGCLSCGEQHPLETMCPPHEVRSSGLDGVMAENRTLKANNASLKVDYDNLWAEVERLNREATAMGAELHCRHRDIERLRQSTYTEAELRGMVAADPEMHRRDAEDLRNGGVATGSASFFVCGMRHACRVLAGRIAKPRATLEEARRLCDWINHNSARCGWAGFDGVGEAMWKINGIGQIEDDGVPLGDAVYHAFLSSLQPEPPTLLDDLEIGFPAHENRTLGQQDAYERLKAAIGKTDKKPNE